MTFFARYFVPPLHGAHAEAGVDQERYPGLHVSEVIASIKEELDPKKYPKGGGDRSKMNLHLVKGFLWEIAFERAWKEYNQHLLVPQSECKVDGIAMNPDGLDVDDGELMEYKGTVRSSRQTGLEVVWTPAGPTVTPIEGPEEALTSWLTNFWDWELQIKSYCRALGTTKAKVVPIFLCGDYRGDKSPQCMIVERSYSQEELEENWQTILEHARWMKEQGDPRARLWEGA